MNHLVKVAITGATGFLGYEVTKRFKDHWDVYPMGYRGAEDNPEIVSCDLTNFTAVFETLSAISPDAIVHCAAATNVDSCQNDPQMAYDLNVLATRNIVDWARFNKPELRLMYISTDQVYSGLGPHSEGQARPLNVYGMTKLWGEDLVQLLPNSLSLRTNLFGLGREGRITFVDWLLGAFEEKSALSLFEDVLFSPLYIDDLVELITYLIRVDTVGQINVGSSGGGMSKADFALLLAQNMGFSTSNVTICKSEKRSDLAPRPKDMRLDTKRLDRILDFPVPGISEGMDKLMLALKQRGWG